MRLTCSAALLLLAACSAPPAPRPITTAEFLSQREGLPLAEAERRIRHQDQLQPLLRAAYADPAFVGAKFVHQPVYRIVFRFTDGRPRPHLIAMAPADMRPHIAFAAAPRSRQEGDRLMNELNTALLPLGRAFNVMYDSETGRFTVNVARRKQLERARQLVPVHLQPHTDVVVGPQVILTGGVTR